MYVQITCKKCGSRQKVMKGTLRCSACNALLEWPKEEKSEEIKKESSKKSKKLEEKKEEKSESKEEKSSKKSGKKKKKKLFSRDK